MSYETSLNAEIDKELDRLTGLKQEWRATFITNAICGKHIEGLADGDHKDFWLHCGYDKTRSAVTKRINRRAGISKEDIEQRQPTLPGYNHVHTYYVVNRNGDDIGIHVDDMTDEEIEQKIASIHKMGKSCFAHVSELKRLKRERAANQKRRAA